MDRRLIITTIFALMLPMAVYANSGEDTVNTGENWGWGLYLDQDLWLPVLNEDRDYTMGIALEFFWQDEDKPLYLFDNQAKKVAEWFGLHRKDDQIVRSFSLGSVNYTPDDLADPNPIYNDRPYASI
ncbi:MAG: lipid A deacylase LpxR family protein, partial [Gammaproteobacteria bacterium]|nr:lipid A deacylase LpxR family protein [Gammaproteobacteria bacterium]